MNREDLVQEVNELTELLRNSPQMLDLRSALARQGVDPRKALLGSFYEDEQSNEYGVVICDDGTVYEYVRATKGSDPATFTTWSRVHDLQKGMGEYPQIGVALDMVRG